MARSTVSIFLRGIEIAARVGVHAWEKHPERPTRLIIDLALEFEHAAYYAESGGYVNYDPLRAFIRELADAPHTEWLETLAERILRQAFATTKADRVKLTIAKPDIFNDVDAVGIVYDVARADFKA